MRSQFANAREGAVSSLVHLARQGDHAAFTRLTAPHQHELHVHCYRMLGSLHDAEDAMQETLLRAWRSLHTFQARASVRAWMYRIATNACVDVLRHRSRRALPNALWPAADPDAEVLSDVREPIWLEPYPTAHLDGMHNDPAARYEMRESVSLAFVATIQYLPPRQRAVLILRDVLGWSAAETANALKTTVTSVNSALQRARLTIKTKVPVAEDVVPANGASHQGLLERYMKAWDEGDADGLAAMLAEDAIMTMPPSPSWYAGRAAIATFHARRVFSGPLRGRLHLVPVEANYQPAFAVYRDDPQTGRREAFAIKVLTLRAGAVAWIAGFADPSLFPLFGLPPTAIAVESG